MLTRNATLVVDAPGVLANDVDAEGDPLEAMLVEDAAFGSVIPPSTSSPLPRLSTGGHFNYLG